MQRFDEAKATNFCIINLMMFEHLAQDNIVSVPARRLPAGRPLPDPHCGPGRSAAALHCCTPLQAAGGGGAARWYPMAMGK